MNVWHICIVNHLSKKVKRFYSLYGPSLGMICTKQGASIQAIHTHLSTPITSISSRQKHAWLTHKVSLKYEHSVHLLHTSYEL